MRKSMRLDAAVKEVLSLGPTKMGQEYLHQFYLCWLYMAGANDPSLLTSLHPRTRRLIEFAQTHSLDELRTPDAITQRQMDSLVSDFPGIVNFYALDALVTGCQIGFLELLVKPEYYEEFFSPSGSNFNLGLYALSWYFATPSDTLPTKHNYELIQRLGQQGEILEPYVESAGLFFSEVAKRVYPNITHVKEHADRTWKTAGYSKKPRSKLTGEAMKALRSIYALDCVGVNPTEHFEALELSGNVVANDIDKDDEIRNLRALVSRFRTKLISKHAGDEANTLHRQSLFSVFIAPNFLTDEFHFACLTDAE